MLVAVGGGSVVDATKVVQPVLAQAMTPDALEPFAAGFERNKPASFEVPREPIRMIAVPTTLSAADFTARAGITKPRHAQRWHSTIACSSRARWC